MKSDIRHSFLGLAAPLLTICVSCSSPPSGEEKDTVDTQTSTETHGDTISDSEPVGVSTDSMSDTGSQWVEWVAPPACTKVVSSSTLDFQGANGVDGNHMVFGDFHAALDEHALFLLKLDTLELEVLQSGPRSYDRPVIKGNWVFWDLATDPYDITTREVYVFDLANKKITTHTNTPCSAAETIPGDQYIGFFQVCALDNENDQLHYWEFAQASSDPVKITDHGQSWGGSGHLIHDNKLFWQTHLESDSHGDRTWLFDFNTLAAPRVVDETVINQLALAASDGALYSGTYKDSTSKDMDVWSYDIASQQRTFLIEDPWDQMVDDVDGHVMIISDTQRLERGLYDAPFFHSDIVLFDVETHVSRRLTEQPDHYGISAVSGKFYVLSHAKQRTFYICDLEAGGFIDSDGHVIPEGSTGMDTDSESGADTASDST